MQSSALHAKRNVVWMTPDLFSLLWDILLGTSPVRLVLGGSEHLVSIVCQCSGFPLLPVALRLSVDSSKLNQVSLLGSVSSPLCV